LKGKRRYGNRILNKGRERQKKEKGGNIRCPLKVEILDTRMDFFIPLGGRNCIRGL